MTIGFVSVTALCLLLGWQATRIEATAGFLPVGWLLAGALVLHTLLLALSLFGLSWTWLTLGLPLAAWLALEAVTARRRRSPRPLAAPGWGPGWGDLVAVLALAVFAAFAWRSWVTTADFFLHWGRKGSEFFHAGRLDYAFLSRPWNWRINPSYPTLLSELYALTALFSGSFRESPMMLWTVLWLLLSQLSARETLIRGGVPPATGQAALAVLGLATATAAIALKLAGGADWMIALALLAASPDLVGPPRVSRHPSALDLAAAFAVSSKQEGIALAGLLLAASAIRDRLARGCWKVSGLIRSATPSLIVGGLWLVQTWRFGLRLHLAIGFPSPRDLRVAASELLVNLVNPAVLGLHLWLLALPLLLASRSTRWLGGIASLQLLVYLWIYLTAAGDTRFLVSATVARLLWQVLPAVMVGAMIALLGEGAPEPERTAEGPVPAEAQGLT